MTTIFVAKLDFGVTEEELQSVFERYGVVAKVNLAKDKETRKPRGFAFVEMPNDHEAQDAIKNLDGYTFNGRQCVVKQADERPDSRGQNRQQGDFKARTERPDTNKSFQQRPASFGDRPKFQSETPPIRPINEDSDTKEILPLKSIPKKKLTPNKKVDIDPTNDGKSKKPKMNAYKKSGKDNLFFDEDDDFDGEIDLFGRSEEEDDEIDEVYSKYVVNSDDDDDDDFDDDFDDDDDDEFSN